MKQFISTPLCEDVLPDGSKFRLNMKDESLVFLNKIFTTKHSMVLFTFHGVPGSQVVESISGFWQNKSKRGNDGGTICGIYSCQSAKLYGWGRTEQWRKISCLHYNTKKIIHTYILHTTLGSCLLHFLEVCKCQYSCDVKITDILSLKRGRYIDSD